MGLRNGANCTQRKPRRCYRWVRRTGADSIATKDVVLEIDEIYFDYDKATIRPESEEALRKIIEYLNIYLTLVWN